MSIATGEVATAADVNAALTAAITRVRKASDETVNNSTVLINDAALKFAVGANAVWAFTILVYQSSSAVADFKCALTSPAGATVVATAIGLATDGTNSINLYNLPAGLAFMGGAGAINPVIHGIIINGANAGNLQLQWAQSTAEVSDTKVLANSCIIAHETW